MLDSQSHVSLIHAISDDISFDRFHGWRSEVYQSPPFDYCVCYCTVCNPVNSFVMSLQGPQYRKLWVNRIKNHFDILGWFLNHMCTQAQKHHFCPIGTFRISNANKNLCFNFATILLGSHLTLLWIARILKTYALKNQKCLFAFELRKVWIGQKWSIWSGVRNMKNSFKVF